MISLTPRFEEALLLALHWHGEQRRKGSGAPYIAHLLGVCALVLEAHGSEDEAIAALLHDAIEDGDDAAAVRRTIRERFGQQVLDIVEGCTDSDTHPKPPWRERKERYIAHLADGSPSVHRVASADKLYNARSIVQDYRADGESLWARFAGGRDGTLWYYRALCDALSTVAPSPMTEELERVFDELERLTAGG